MNEKTKKYLAEAVYRVGFAFGIFIILFAINFFSPSLVEKISPAWIKNTNFQKAGKLLLGIFKEIFPF